MTVAGPYELVVTPPARRALGESLPEAVAVAVIEFLTQTPLHEQRRVGKPLRGQLSGIYSARRGSYRLLYRIQEDKHDVVVL